LELSPQQIEHFTLLANLELSKFQNLSERELNR